MSDQWTQAEAIALCVRLESFAPKYGAHIGLTGGCLYRDGARKDADILLYRIRQSEEINFDGFFDAIGTIGVHKLSGFGFCHKALFEGKHIDFLSPEEEGDEYPTVDPADKLTTDDLIFP